MGPSCPLISLIAELSDSQLRVLADIVQNEIERYNDDEPAEYEIIEIPDEVIAQGEETNPLRGRLLREWLLESDRGHGSDRTAY